MTSLTDLLRRALLEARRDGDRAATASLRAALATLANAEAVPVAADAPTVASEHVAGLGSGPTEAERRELTTDEQRVAVHEEIADLEAAATTYDGVDPDRAEAARAGARVLRRVLSDHEG
jgi:hypothetical protein